MPDTRTDRDTQIIAKYEQDLLSGVVFTRWATAERSYIGYRPPTHRRDFALLVEALGKLAGESDETAQIVHAMVTKLHLYGNTEELYASAYQAAAEAVRKGYTDVIGLASPEPPRRRDALRPYQLSTLLRVDETLSLVRHREVGWCAKALIERERSAYRMR